MDVNMLVQHSPYDGKQLACLCLDCHQHAIGYLLQYQPQTQEDAGIHDDDDDDDDDPTPAVVQQPVVAAPQQQPVLNTPGAVRPGSLDTPSTNTVPPVYIAKYNRFVDNILTRINRILRKNYDPVNVRLNPSGDSKNNKKKNNKKKPNKATGPKSREGEQETSPVGAAVKANSTEQLAAAVAAVSELAGNKQGKPHSQRLVMVQVPTIEKTGRAKTNNTTNKNNNRNKNNKNKKKGNGRNRSGARATLYGLSSIKRDGDVTVNMMSSHTTVKTKFTVGPLMLKVEKEFGRGAKKDIRSATATTTEMSGKLNLRVMHGGAATLHSIRVMQPRQVRVESADDHDKTSEYVWRRSSNIARVVSQKLTNATRSMLQPPPITTSFMSTIFS